MLPVRIVIANRKGGTGKTTTAVNLAAGLAAQGLQTLLIDLDTQGQSALGCGIAPVKPAVTAHDLLRGNGADPARAVMASSLPKLDVVVGDRWSSTPPVPEKFEVIDDVLSRRDIEERYDVIIVDTAPALDGVLVNALVAADGVVIPFLPHPLSVDGAHQFAKALFVVRSQLKTRLKHFAFLPVQFNQHVRVHRSTAARLSQEFGSAKMLSPIRTDIKLAEAFDAGKPARDFAPFSRGAQDYEDVVSRIASDWLGCS